MEVEWCVGPDGVWFVPIHAWCSFPPGTPSPRTCPSSLHSAGQPRAKSQLGQVSLPRLSFPGHAGPSPPRTPACEGHGGPFSRDRESSFDLSTFLCRSLLSARGKPVSVLNLLLTVTAHCDARPHAQTNTKSSSPAYITWLNSTYRLPLYFSYEICLHLLYFAPNGPFPPLQTFSYVFMLPTSLGRIIDLHHSFRLFQLR